MTIGSSSRRRRACSGGTRQLEALTSTHSRGWCPVTTERLPAGAAKANWLAELMTTTWRDLGQPCSAAAVEEVVAYSGECAAGFDPERAVLVHGDGRAHNLLQVAGSDDRAPSRLTDPEGLVSEPAHDLGVVLRAWNEELLAGDTAKMALERCEEGASSCGIDADAVWPWAPHRARLHRAVLAASRPPGRSGCIPRGVRPGGGGLPCSRASGS